MGKVIAVVSGKGGTGKTSVTAGVGVALSQHRKRVLVLDMDMGMRNLDFPLGMSDRVFMDFSDVVEDRCQLMDAVVTHPQYPDLSLLTAPLYPRDTLTPESLVPLMESASRLFDYVLVDAPSGTGLGFRFATIQASRALVVSTIDRSALRNARRVVEELSHISDMQLVMNRIQPKIMEKIGTTVDDVMDLVGLPLLGLIPEDSNVFLSAQEGVAVTGKTIAGKGYENIALRLMGQNCPLMKIK